MKIRYFPIVAAAVIVPLHVVGAQDMATLKVEADLEKVRADTAKVYSDLMSGLRSAEGGSAIITTPEASAEGVLLSHHVYSGAAARLAMATAQWQSGSSKQPLVVIGSRPPSVSEWLALDEGAKRLKANLTNANAMWNAAYPPPRADRGRFEALMGGTSAMAGFGPIGAALGVITSVASLFRVETSIGGSVLAADDPQVETILARALSEQGFVVDHSELDIVASHERVERILTELDPLYGAALENYRDGYIRELRREGSVDKLNGAVALAGSNLATVIADYQALRKALYTPVDGALPITAIERQAKLHEAVSSRRIIYVRARKAALSTVTKKNFFTGYGDVPAHFAAIAIIDYMLVDPLSVDRPASATSGSVSCAIAKVRLADAFATIRTRPVPSHWVGRRPDDVARVARIGTADGICEGEPVQGLARAAAD